MEKIDLYKQHKDDYAAPKSPKLINIVEANYLTVNGRGAPGEEDFDEAVSALYAMAYTIKMTRKKQEKGDYVICKLEARYWSEQQKCLASVDKENWHWQLMIRTPDHVEQTDVTQAAQALLDKNKTPRVQQVKMLKHHFGQCIQMLHIGAYEEEARTLNQMISFANDQNLLSTNEHCEVYISDPRRIPAERLKTILRMPIKQNHG